MRDILGIVTVWVAALAGCEGGGGEPPRAQGTSPPALTSAATAQSTATATASASAAVPVPTAIDETGPPVRVRLGAIETKNVAEEEVRKALTAEQGRLGGCYQLRRRANDTLEGRFAVAFELGADGKPQQVTQASTDMDDDELGRCLLRAVELMALPKPAATGTASVTAHMVFAPG